MVELTEQQLHDAEQTRVPVAYDSESNISVHQRAIFQTFVDPRIETAFQRTAWAQTFWVQLITVLVIIVLRVTYITILFAGKYDLVGTFIVAFLQLGNLLFMLMVLVALKITFPMRKEKGEPRACVTPSDDQRMDGRTSTTSSSQPKLGSDGIHLIDGAARIPLYLTTDDEEALAPSTDGKSAFRKRYERAMKIYIQRGYFSHHWCFVLVIEAAAVLVMDWMMCETTSTSFRSSVCVSYSASLFPLPPSLTAVLASFSIAMLTTSIVVAHGGILLIMTLLFFQSGFLFVVDGTSAVVYDIVRVGLLLSGAVAVALAFASAKQHGQRESFALLWVLQFQHQRERQQMAREKAALDELNHAREEQIAAAAARGVQELTLGYVGHQAANVVHQLQYACDSLASNALMPPESREHVTDLEEALSRLKRILNDVLSHQKLMSGRVSLTPERCNLRSNLQAFQSNMQVSYPRPSLLDVEDDVPDFITFDWFRLEQMLANSYSNAIAAGNEQYPISITAKLVLAPVAGDVDICSNNGVITEPEWIEVCEQYTKDVKNYFARHKKSTSSTASVLKSVERLQMQLADGHGGTLDGSIHANTEPRLTAGRTSEQRARTASIDGGLESMPSRWSSPSIPDHLPTAPPDWSWWLHLEIANRGLGLPDGDPLQFFMPFDASHQTVALSNRYRNTGLGLPITRLLAIMMRARVGLVDTVVDPDGPAPRLTRFFIHISLKQLLSEKGAISTSESRAAGGADVHVPMEPDSGQVARGGTSSHGSAGSVRSAAWERSSHALSISRPQKETRIHSPKMVPLHRDHHSLSKPRILIVDDLAANRKVNARLVSKLGCIAEQATDGDEVMDLVRAAVDAGQGFDAIMLDIVMQRQHGDETCVQLRNAGFTMPIIAASGNAAESDRVRYLEAGFDAVLAKPFSVDRLRDCFSQLGIPTE